MVKVGVPRKKKYISAEYLLFHSFRLFCREVSASCRLLLECHEDMNDVSYFPALKGVEHLVHSVVRQ